MHHLFLFLVIRYSTCSKEKRKVNVYILSHTVLEKKTHCVSQILLIMPTNNYHSDASSMSYIKFTTQVKVSF